MPVRADLGVGSVALALDEVPVPPLEPPPGWAAISRHAGGAQVAARKLVGEG